MHLHGSEDFILVLQCQVPLPRDSQGTGFLAVLAEQSLRVHITCKVLSLKHVLMYVVRTLHRKLHVLYAFITYIFSLILHRPYSYF